MRRRSDSNNKLLYDPNQRMQQRLGTFSMDENSEEEIDDEEVRVYDYLETPDKISDILSENKIKIKGFYEYGISLEDYFKEIIKEAK